MSPAVQDRSIGQILQDVTSIAAERNQSTEELLESLLSAHLTERSGGFELDSSHLNEIREILGAGIGKPKELIDRVRRLATIQVNSTRIRLSPMLLERLSTRARHRTMPEFLKEIVPECLERYVGMR